MGITQFWVDGRPSVPKHFLSRCKFLFTIKAKNNNTTFTMRPLPNQSKDAYSNAANPTSVESMKNYKRQTSIQETGNWNVFQRKE